jgi:spermidine synthase
MSGSRLYNARSRLQEIELFREPDGSIGLTLDGVWQFSSRDEHIFHEALVDPPMVMSPDPTRVLVLGGGDGLALRNVLRYEPVRRAVVCEIDPLVVEMTRTVPEMVELARDSLRDPRVEVVIDDALDFLLETDEVFDVVMCDFPACTRPELEPLFSGDFFGRLTRVTHPQSVIATQVSLDPPRFWEVLQAVELSFAWTLPLLVELEAAGSHEPCWADFVVASEAERAPVRALAPGLSFLTLEKLPRLAIKNRWGGFFETDEYQKRPDFSED